MTYNQLDPEKCEFFAVAAVDELPNGQRLYLEIDDLYLIVFNIADNYFAIADLCSHDEEPLDDGELDGHAVICPRHGARFDVRTGQALTPPAVEAIPAYPVRVHKGNIEVGLPKE
ncbi:MAG: non-heme iron oxygenase ferredoxin subunit [Chloroflexi bacterium]|nr:non-heme iron oxygenase ferredoxin subunit [Chloroflexota bacterium]